MAFGVGVGGVWVGEIGALAIYKYKYALRVLSAHQTPNKDETHDSIDYYLGSSVVVLSFLTLLEFTSTPYVRTCHCRMPKASCLTYFFDPFTTFSA